MLSSRPKMLLIAPDGPTAELAAASTTELSVAASAGEDRVRHTHAQDRREAVSFVIALFVVAECQSAILQEQQTMTGH